LLDILIGQNPKGAVAIIYFLIFAPFNRIVTVDNPDYAPDKPVTRWSDTQSRFKNEEVIDNTKRFVFALSAGIGTSALLFITKGRR
jgi:hypothetical protein